ncbi:hypothetical protein SETIT_2G020400v2 [Setaria italica]|uniref:Uncharacterized protein n=1 Tax=Setaria italica TaxID=4555 RepID=A0A368PV72_SETIT|nr:hypothetical protein SETIT_2G020400v2 [Setaria italica]
MPESHASHQSLAGHTPPQQCRAMGCRSRCALGPCRCSHARPCGTAIIAAVGPPADVAIVGFCCSGWKRGGTREIRGQKTELDRPRWLGGATGHRRWRRMDSGGSVVPRGVRPPSRSQGQCKGLSLFSTLLAT